MPSYEVTRPKRKPAKRPINTSFCKMFMPYCIEPLEDGSWIFLNRYYKPLGLATDDFVRYEDHPSRVDLRMTRAVKQKLAVNLDYEERGRIYLYNDGCAPTSAARAMTQYIAKLAILAKVRIAKASPSRRALGGRS